MPSDRKGRRIEAGIWVENDGNGYIAEVSYIDPHTGMRIREFKTINRLDASRQWRQTRKADALRGLIRGGKKKVKAISFESFADEYFRTWSLSRKPSTVECERKRLKGILKPYFEKMPIHTITRRDIEIFITRRREHGVTVATTNRELCRLKNMLGYAVNWGYIESNPAAGIKQERESIEEADYLSLEEVKALLVNCSDAIRPLLTLAVNTRIRWGELMTLEWRDVDLRRGLITVRKPKNDETRHVPMNNAVRETLAAHQQDQTRAIGGIATYVFQNPRTGVPYKDLRSSYQDALDDAKITRSFTFHGLRHTAASHMIMSGIDRGDVGRILGHKTPQMTRRYEHLAPDYLKATIEKPDYTRAEKAEEQQAAKDSVQSPIASKRGLSSRCVYWGRLSRSMVSPRRHRSRRKDPSYQSADTLFP